MNESYTLHVAGLVRELKKVRIDVYKRQVLDRLSLCFEEPRQTGTSAGRTRRYMRNWKRSGLSFRYS